MKSNEVHKKIRSGAALKTEASWSSFYAMMSITGIVLSAVILSLVAGKDLARDILAGRLIDHQSSLSWLYSITLALTAFQALRLVGISAKRTHQFFWNGAALVFLVLSAAEICSVGELTGWIFFEEVSSKAFFVIGCGVIGFLFTWGALILRSTLENSYQASKMLLLGSLLFLVGHAGADYVLWTADSTDAAVFPLLSFYTLKILGIVGFFGGFVLHENHLVKDIERIETGRKFDGIPTVRSENAAWTLRMIDTPVANHEVSEEASSSTEVPR